MILGVAHIFLHPYLVGPFHIRLYHPGPRVVPDPFIRFHGSRHVGPAAQCTLGIRAGDAIMHVVKVDR